MQLSLPWRFGQNKPYASIPRINWAHPLAQGLATYAYDLGGVIVDLAQGGLSKRVGTTVRTTKLGNGFKYSTTSDYAYLPASDAASTIGTVLPYSFAMGTISTGTPPGVVGSTIAGITSSTDSFDNGPTFGINAVSSTKVSIFWNNGGTVTDFVTLKVSNTFQTWVVVPTAAATATLYASGKLDSSVAAISSTTFTLPSGSGRVVFNVNSTTGTGAGGILGFVPYYAAWSRRLSAADARQLHDDPYCFLIYPEDEMFATLVGGAAFQWYPMNFLAFPEEPIINPRVEITGY